MEGEFVDSKKSFKQTKTIYLLKKKKKKRKEKKEKPLKKQTINE